MSHGAALGAMALAFDDWPMMLSPKLKSVEGNPEARDYLVAAYCFDTARKLEYVYKATKRYALQADPELAAEIKRDNEALAKTRGNWKATAETAEGILLRLLGDIVEEHKTILDLVARPKK
jgi:hypothetical protein